LSLDNRNTRLLNPEATSKYLGKLQTGNLGVHGKKPRRAVPSEFAIKVPRGIVFKRGFKFMDRR
jgi:hypothetical protein